MSTLAEILAEGKRLEAAASAAGTFDYRPAVLSLHDFYIDHGPRLLAVAEAAVEWAMADDEYDAVPPSSRDTDAFESNLFRRQAARRALSAAAGKVPR